MIDYSENPDFRRLSTEFIEFVRFEHAKHDFTEDWRAMARSYGIDVLASDQNLYTIILGRPTIQLDRTETGGRRSFSFAHELSHYLFSETKEAFQAVLEEAMASYSPEDRYQAEEAICYEAAAVLLFPEQVVRDVVLANRLDPQSVFDLAEMRGGSLWAALVRVVSSFSTKLWGYVIDLEGTVEFAWSSTKYRPGRGFRVPMGHPVLLAWSEPVEVEAHLMFKGPRSWPVEMKAATNGRRIVALFADPFPALPDSQQGGLFDF